MTKKLLSLLLVLAVGSTLVACNSEGGDTDLDNGGAGTETPTESPSP